jgi:hypothetical protein
MYPDIKMETSKEEYCKVSIRAEGTPILKNCMIPS